MTENQKQMKKNYFLLPWYQKWLRNVKNTLVMRVRNWRFPWKKLFLLLILALLVFTIYGLVSLSRITVPLRKPYDKTGFIEATDYLRDHGNETVLENGNYQIRFDNRDTTFVFTDKLTGEEWRSNPQDASSQYQDPMIVWYAGALGAATPMGVYENAVEYDDYLLRIQDSSIEVLYEIGGKKEVDESDFPKILTEERMQEKILSRLEPGSTPYRRVTEQFYVSGTLEGTKIWSLKDGIQKSMLKTLYKIMYEDCGYTKEDLKQDLNQFGVIYEDTYAYIEVAIRYTLSEQGLDIRVISDSISEKEKFPLVSIEVLPYFGAATVEETGYFMIPDGSGVLIDFNNRRSFNVAYNQRIYGNDLALNRSEMPLDSEIISLPLYGMKKNNSGFISIAAEGAEMASIIAKTSSADRPYNQAYYEMHIRESEVFTFEAINQSPVITEWTDWYSESDLNLILRFIHEDEGGYNGMAASFRDYLTETGFLTPKDQTGSLVFDLTLLGGYVKKENFLGVPYQTVRSLTNTEEVKTIADRLLADQISDLRLVYKGWANDGLKPTYMGNIRFHDAIGTGDDFRDLSQYLKNKQVAFYPEVYVNTAYTGRDLDISKDTIRNVFGKTFKNYAYNQAILYADYTTTEYYTLKPSLYVPTLEGINRDFTKNSLDHIAFGDWGSVNYGSYDKRDNFFRTDMTTMFRNAGNKYLPDFNSVLFRNPCFYALPYADAALDLPFAGTDYQIVGMSVPFLELVFSGFLDYSLKSLNLNDKYSFDYLIMKTIETAANLSFTWSYDSTIELSETEYNEYYSTYYLNWYDKAVQAYRLLDGIHFSATSLSRHEILVADGSVTKSTYANGMEIVFNYGVGSFLYQDEVIEPISYRIVKEAD